MPRKRVDTLDSYHDLPLDDPLRRKIQNRNAQRVYRARHSNRSLSTTSRLTATSSGQSSTPREPSPAVAISRDSSCQIFSDSPSPDVTFLEASARKAEVQSAENASYSAVPRYGPLGSDTDCSPLQAPGDDDMFNLWLADSISEPILTSPSPQRPTIGPSSCLPALDQSMADTNERDNGATNTAWSATMLQETNQSRPQDCTQPLSISSRDAGLTMTDHGSDTDFTWKGRERPRSQQRNMQLTSTTLQTLSTPHGDDRSGRLRPRAHRSISEHHVRAYDSGRHLIHTAAQSGQVHIIRLVLNPDFHINVNLRDSMGRSALHIAAEEGHSDVVKFLICSGGSLDLEDHEGWTPLHLAARGGHAECVSLLLKLGADTWQRAS